MKRLFLFSSLLLLFSQCRWGYDGGRYMDFYNNSGKPVCYYMPWKDGVFYPDTLLPDIVPKPYNPYKINKEWHFSLSYSENQLFAKFPTDTMSIFFFDPDTLAKYDWQTIREEYKILVRYDFSHNDLKNLNWRIDFPPTEDMRHIRMYPPYGVYNEEK